MKGLMVMLLMALAAACDRSEESCINEDLIDQDAICTMEYDPVCGCDGKTYSNDCRAINAGVTDYKPGDCSESEPREEA